VYSMSSLPRKITRGRCVRVALMVATLHVSVSSKSRRVTRRDSVGMDQRINIITLGVADVPRALTLPDDGTAAIPT